MIEFRDFSNEHSFWKTYPEYLTFPEFAALQDLDKSKGNADSSQAMWAMLFYCHPKSPYFYLPNKEETLEKNVLKGKGSFVVFRESGALELFEDICTSEAEKSMRAWSELMKKRRKFMNDVEYSSSDMKKNETIDKMAERNKKIYDDYFVIKKALDDEYNSQAGTTNSLSDSALF